MNPSQTPWESPLQRNWALQREPEVLVSGSIDSARVRGELLRLLEGGEVAFARRREMYLSAN